MSRDLFLSTVTVLDTETNNLHPEKADIVEIAGARYINGNWDVDGMLMGAEIGIPPEASAKNHISNRMIAGLPTFAESQSKISKILHLNNTALFVAHNCKYDQTVLAKSWLECDREDLALTMADQKNWICTFRLSKQLLSIDFDDMQYNLNFLRYKLDLPVSDTFAAHRAGADTLTCALLFEFLVDYAIALGLVKDDTNLSKSMHELCWKPKLIGVWPFGKHKGKPLNEIETDYYMWAIENMDALNESKDGYDADLAASVAVELETRL